MNLRKDGLVGLFEYSGLIDVSIHFNEWWNGEGFDYSINNKPIFSIHSNELSAMVAIGIATGYIDIDDCKEMAEQLLEQSKKREQHTEDIKKEIQVKERRNQITLVTDNN